MKNISIEEIFPFVRFAQVFTVYYKNTYGILTAYDNRLFLCVNGRGNIVVDNTKYRMKKGSLIMWHAGVEYSYEADENESMELIGFNFDFTCDASKNAVPIPPAKEREFDISLVTERVNIVDAPRLNSTLYFEKTTEAESNIQYIKDEYICKKRYYSRLCSVMLARVMIDLARDASTSDINTRRKAVSDDIIAYIHLHYAEPLSNKLLGQIFGYHPMHICRLISKATGVSTHQYIINYRIERAIDMLQSGKANVSETAEMCGFFDLAHFSKCFKTKTGFLPSSYLN